MGFVIQTDDVLSNENECYGLYSLFHDMADGIHYYKNRNGEEVAVTEVTKSKETEYSWHNPIYMGVMTEYVRFYKVPKRYISDLILGPDSGRFVAKENGGIYN